jgi:phosphate transport system substrate-binding protein
MVYSGEITNWKELGGNDEKIRVLVRDQSSGTYGFFKEHVLGDKAYTKNAIIEPNTEAVVKDVSLNTASLGYIGLAYMDESVKIIGLGTFYPNAGTIRRGTYPLSRPLYYYTDGEPEGTVKEYIDFVLSAQGQEILSDIGYLPFN